MIRLSIPLRQALARLTLPMLVLLTFAMMLIGKADVALTARVRMTLDDALAPIYAELAPPLVAVRGVFANAGRMFSLARDNAVLRAENARLRQWQAVAVALDAENIALKANLRWLPDPPADYVTARVVADVGGVYARAMLLSVGPNHSVRRGQIALDRGGLVGRVSEVGGRSARVLLITDINSRIPVTLVDSRAHAMLIGTNAAMPRLMFWPEEQPPREGERVVTSAEADAFPPNLPVGVVHYNAAHVPEVRPAADLSRLEIVRLFDYDLRGLLPPEADLPPERRAANAPRAHVAH